MLAMSEFPDKYFDLAVVDPPYGLPKDSSNGRGKLKNRTFNKMDILCWDAPPQKEYFAELTRVSKNQIIWGGNYFDLPPTRGIICWDKMQPFPNFSAFEMAWTSFDCVARIFRFDNRTGNKIHPTQKPIKLYDWIFKNYAKEGMKILDTHLGSGSSRISAHKAGLDFWGYELDKEYFEAQEKRYKDFIAQGVLF